MVYVLLCIIAAGLFALPRTLPTWATCIIVLGGLVAALVITYHHVVVTFG
jgi:hypothetical protein